MPQVIQIKRRIGAGGTGGPGMLAAGELAYNVNGQALFVGSDAVGTVTELVGVNRQLEIHANGGNQTVAAGIKTWAAGAKIAIGVLDLNVSGGATGNFLQTDGLGNLTWAATSAGITEATDAQITAGTDETTYVSPQGLRSQTGADCLTLVTAAKVIVPAINELKVAIDAIATDSQFVGSFDATASTILWVAGTSAGDTLPPPTAANNGWYIIATFGGVNPPAGATAGTYNVGDWLISNGTLWTHLAFGGVAAATASQIPVNPAVNGATDVQAALEAGAANDLAQDADLAGKVDRIGDTMTGALYLFNQTPAVALEAAAKGYVDTKVAGPALSVLDNLAAFSDATGKTIKDTGQTLAGIQAAAKTYVDAANSVQDGAIIAGDNLRVLKAGDTMTGPLILPIAAPLTDPEAANKKYVDDSLASAVGGTTVVVQGPELIGDGLAANPITFTGVAVAANSATSLVGDGLSATGLDIVLIDGGTY